MKPYLKYWIALIGAALLGGVVLHFAHKSIEINILAILCYAFLVSRWVAPKKQGR